MVVGELSAPIRGDTIQFRRDLNQVQNMGLDLASKMTANMQNFGNSLKSVADKITKFITLPLAGASIAVFKLGKDFETEMAKIVGLVGVSQKQVDEWAREIIKIAPDLAKSPQELAEALFFVSSAGLRGSEAMDALIMSAKASSAGLGETKTIADLVTSAMNAYGSENLSASKATDILVAAVREGKAEASELAASMGQVLPLASEMGVTFDQVAATQAAMTKTGTNASEAATQLKSILAGLIKPSKQAEEQLNAMGTSSSDMRKKIKEEGLLNALMDLRKMTNKYGEEAMARVFPNIRALMGVLDLMGSNMFQNKKTFEAVTKSSGSLGKAFEVTSKTLDFKWNTAINNVKSRLLGFFDVLKGIMIPILEKFTKVTDFVSNKFAGMSPQFQKVIAVLGGSGALLGPVLAAIGTGIALLAGAVGGIISGITALSGVIATVGLPALAGIAAGVAAAFAVVTAWIIGIIAVITGLIASFKYLWNTNQEFRNNVISTWNSIKESAREIFAELKIIAITVFNNLKKFWNKHGEDIIAIIGRAFNLIMFVVKNGMKIIKDVIKFISAVIKGDWNKAWNSIKSIMANVNTIIIALLYNLKNIAINIIKILISGMISLFGKLLERGSSLFGTLVGKIISKIKNLASSFKVINWYKVGLSIIQSIINGINAKVGQLKEKMNSIAREIRNRLPFSPAKVGPLSDLDKLDFGTPIASSLEKAKKLVIGKTSELGNIFTNGIIPGVNANTGNSGGVVFSGDFNFYGVQDVDDFMKEMKEIVQRFGGKF